MQYFTAFGGEEEVIEDLRRNRRERWRREASAEPKLTEKEEDLRRAGGGFGGTEAY